MAGKPITQNPAFVAIQEQVNEQGAKLDTLVDNMATIASSVSAMSEAITSLSLAKNRPVVKNNYMESEEQFQGTEGDVEFSERDGDQVIERLSEVETERVLNSDKMRDLAFNNEMLSVRIEETSDEKAPQVFEIEVNGEKEFFRRGETKKVKRYFVEGLARAKPINYASEEYLGNDGLKHVRYPTTKGVRYPFSLINPKPIDQAWLQSILAQP